jgi:hypothetical protein
MRARMKSKRNLLIVRNRRMRGGLRSLAAVDYEGGIVRHGAEGAASLVCFLLFELGFVLF